MKVSVVTCFPLTLVKKLKGMRAFTIEMEAETSESVKDFKARYFQDSRTYKDYDVTVCVEGQERKEDQCLWDGPTFKVDKKTQGSFIHLRVEDPELNERALAYMNSSIYIPLDKVRRKDDTAKDSSEKKKKKNTATHQEEPAIEAEAPSLAEVSAGEGHPTDTARTSPSTEGECDNDIPYISSAAVVIDG